MPVRTLLITPHQSHAQSVVNELASAPIDLTDPVHMGGRRWLYRVEKEGDRFTVRAYG